MIDASIALGVKPPQIESPMNALAQVLQVKQAQQGQQMNALKMDEYQRGIESQNRLRQLLGGFGADHTANQQKLMQGGFMKEAQDYGKNQASISKDQTATEKDQLANVMQKLALGAQLLGGVRDQASYDQARATAQANGLDVSRMQPNYDPAFVEAKRKEGQTMAQQIDQYWKQKGYDTPDANAVLSAQTSRANNASSNATQMRGQNMTDSRGRALLGIRQQEVGLKQAGANKPLPVGALKMRVEAQDAADTADGVNQRLTNVEKRMTDGKLSFGPVSNLMSSGLNAAGMSTENSRNFASFKSEMEKLRNDSLRLNKGVQTDGDAQRAWNELFQNINDTKLVKQRLSEIKEINARAKTLRLMEVDTINRNYGRDAEPQGRIVLDEADAILNGG